MKVLPHGGYSDFPMQVLINGHYHVMDEDGHVPSLKIVVPESEWEIEPIEGEKK